jgi:hypothetical protein
LTIPKLNRALFREWIGRSILCVPVSQHFFEEATAMKILLAVATVLALTAAPAFAGEGQVSHKSLAKMGLSSMQTLSDNDGMQIRGLSIAVVGGWSTAGALTFNGYATTTNFYFAAGSHSASGSNASIAGSGGLFGSVVGAGGFSTASAH